ncbi:hypothetical protein ElyMa_000763900 [Elysia marginata]|uniref:Uncharacterized protein n=1 Tax=Elysia marginata TaxID=1093978 RepID=A0AAV4GUF8_9GAST|nr:hypothetical protein ElyMa_000763900 [Elysia marginata]
MTLSVEFLDDLYRSPISSRAHLFLKLISTHQLLQLEDADIRDKFPGACYNFYAFHVKYAVLVPAVVVVVVVAAAATAVGRGEGGRAREIIVAAATVLG